MSAANSHSPVRFSDWDISSDIADAISAKGWDFATPIQAEAIPQTMEGRDILGLAQTGTGKTAAFALPLIQRLTENGGNNPRALILAPTRELVVQIHRLGLGSKVILGLFQILMHMALLP